jgi:hypothetical protein
MTPAVSVTGLTRRYPGQVALDNVHLTIGTETITGPAALCYPVSLSRSAAHGDKVQQRGDMPVRVGPAGRLLGPQNGLQRCLVGNRRAASAGVQCRRDGDRAGAANSAG